MNRSHCAYICVNKIYSYKLLNLFINCWKINSGIYRKRKISWNSNLFIYYKLSFLDNNLMLISQLVFCNQLIKHKNQHHSSILSMKVINFRFLEFYMFMFCVITYYIDFTLSYLQLWLCIYTAHFTVKTRLQNASQYVKFLIIAYISASIL